MPHSGVLLRQAARLLGVSPDTLNETSARDAFRTRPGDVAYALFREAAENDDVIDRESARDYLEDRLDVLAPLLDPETADAIRKAFEQRLQAW